MKNSFIIAGAIILFAFGLVACGDDDAPAVGSSSAVSSSSAAASSSSVISSSAGTSSSSAISSSAGTISVTFTELAANGASGSVTTTELTLTFSLDPAGLAASDITVTGATRGALSGTGLTRRLAISDITVANGANLTV